MKFSIIVPAYNAEDFLCGCVMSVLNQTFADWELIIIDDGSTDESGILADQFALEDKRIRVFHQENRGQFYARRCGIENATGDYLIFLDSDDEITHNCLEIIANTVQNSNIDIVFYVGRIVCGGLETDQYVGNLGAEKKNISADEIKRTLISSNDFNSLWLKAFKRGLFEDDSTDYSAFLGTCCGEDKAQLFYPITKATNIVYIPECLYRYNYRENSVMHIYDMASASKKLSNEMFNLMYEYMKIWGKTDKDCIRKAAVYYLRTFLVVYYDMRKKAIACGEFKQFRKYNWMEHLNKKAFKYCLSRELGTKEKLKLLAAAIGF